MTHQPDQRHPATLIVVLAVILGTVAGAFYMMNRADARARAVETDRPDLPIPVETFTIHPVTLPRIISARGFFNGIADVTVPSEVAGLIVTRQVEEGSAVHEGDVLVRIDDTFYRLDVQNARAQLARVKAQAQEAASAVEKAKAQVTAAQAMYDNGKAEYDRMAELYQGGNASKYEFDRIEASYRKAEADLTAAGAALNGATSAAAMANASSAVAQATLEEAEARLERCVVRSPIDGRINRYFVEQGEYAVATAPLVDVVRLDKLKMIVDLAGTEVKLLREFTSAEAVADADERVHQARLHHVAPKIDPASKKFRVEFHVDNADGSLLAGMYGGVTITCGELHNVPRLPREAVFKHYGADACLVVTDDDGRPRAALRRIAVRDIVGRIDEVEVVTGLNEGDRVIVSRRRELHNGVHVEVVQDLAATDGDAAANQRRADAAVASSSTEPSGKAH